MCIENYLNSRRWPIELDVVSEGVVIAIPTTSIRQVVGDPYPLERNLLNRASYQILSRGFRISRSIIWWENLSWIGDSENFIVYQGWVGISRNTSQDIKQTLGCSLFKNNVIKVLSNNTLVDLNTYLFTKFTALKHIRY